MRIVIETAYVERTELYVIVGRAMDDDGAVVNAVCESAPAYKRPAMPANGEAGAYEVRETARWVRARERATRDTIKEAGQVVAAWVMEVLG